LSPFSYQKTDIFRNFAADFRKKREDKKETEETI